MERILEEKTYWTGSMISIFLKRELSEMEFYLLPSNWTDQWKNSSYLIEDIKLISVLENIATELRGALQGPIIKILLKLGPTRNSSYSAQYFQLKGACLDFLRRPATFRTATSHVFASKQEYLHIFGEIFITISHPRSQNEYELIRIMINYEMDKIAKRLKTYEPILLAPQFSEFDESIKKLALDELKQFMSQNCMSFVNLKGLERKQWMTKFVFGSDDHYLIPYFQSEFDRMMESAEPEEWETDEFTNPIQILFYGRSLLNLYLKQSRPYLLDDSINLTKNKMQYEKPFLRLITLDPNDKEKEKFMFVKEVENIVKVVHTIKRKAKAFVRGSLPTDENDGIFNLIESKKLNQIMKAQGLLLSDISIAEMKYDTNIHPLSMIVHSPTYSMSIPAGVAFSEIFATLMRETIEFLLFPAEHVDKFRRYIEDLYDFFIPEKENVYTISYDTYLSLRDDGIKGLKPFLKSPDNFQGFGRALNSVEAVKKIFNELGYPKKFKYFNHYFDLIIGSAKQIESETAEKIANKIVYLSFFTEFPKISQFIHNQRTCHLYPLCTLEFVKDIHQTNRPRCREENVSSTVLFIRKRFSIGIHDNPIDQNSIIPEPSNKDEPSTSSPLLNPSSSQKLTKSQRRKANKLKNEETQREMRERSETQELPSAPETQITAPKTSGNLTDTKKHDEKLRTMISSLELENSKKDTEIRELKNLMEKMKSENAESLRRYEETILNTNKEAVHWKTKHEEVLKSLESEKKRLEEASKNYRKKYNEWKTELANAKENSERVPVDEHNLRHELNNNERRISNLFQIITKIADFGVNIKWKDVFVAKGKEKLEKFISNNYNNDHAITLANHKFNQKRQEYEAYAAVAIENIQLLAETPELETLQKLRPMPEMPTPFDIDEKSSNCTIC